MLEVEDKKEQEEPDGLMLVSFVMVWPEQDMENLPRDIVLCCVVLRAFTGWII